MESRNGIHTLEPGEAIGFGSRTYKLVSIDSNNTSVGSVWLNEVQIYPNPASSAIHIPKSENYDYIQIVDLNGKTISKLNSYPEISVANLNKGTYFIQFYTKSKVVGITKFIRN